MIGFKQGKLHCPCLLLERPAPRGGPARNPRDASGNPLHVPINRGNLGDVVPSNPPYTMPYRDYHYGNQPMVGSHGLAVLQGRQAPALHGNVGPAHYVPQARDNWGSLTGDPDPYQRYGEPPPYPAVNQLPYWAPPGGVQPPNHQPRDAYGNPVRQEWGRDRDCGPVGRDAKLSKYNGNVPWRAYEVKVLRMARTYNWDNDMIIVKLVDALQDDALKFYSSLEVDVQDNYELLSRRMNKRFGPQEPPQTVRKELRMVEQKPEEPLEEWAECCQRLAKNTGDASGGNPLCMSSNYGILGDAVQSTPQYSMPSCMIIVLKNQPMGDFQESSVPPWRQAPTFRDDVVPLRYIPRVRDDWRSLASGLDPLRRYGEPPPYPTINLYP